jgi:hypothetical protein
MRKVLAIITLIVAMTAPAGAAGSATLTATDVGAGVTQYSIAWVSDASGNVSGNTLAIKAGVLVAVKFVPDGGGTQPSDLYDVTFQDASDVDLLMGGGANLSNAAATRKKPALNTSDEVWFEGCSACELNITNAGNAKGGTVVLWVRG